MGSVIYIILYMLVMNLSLKYKFQSYNCNYFYISCFYIKHILLILNELDDSYK